MRSAAPGGLAPAWLDSYSASRPTPSSKASADYADTSAPMPNLAEMDQVWPALSQAEVDVMAGENPAKTMKAAGREIQ